MKFLNLITLVTSTALFLSCQAPKEPAALKSDSSPKSSPAPISTSGANTVGASAAGAATLASCGIQVGTDTMKANVKACRDKGLFYDRQFIDPVTKAIVGQCTTAPLAQIPCSISDVKAAMSPTDATTFDTYLADANSLKDFIVDQVLDCSAAASFPGCEAPGNTAGLKVVKLYLVKSDPTQILVKTLMVYLPAK